LLKAAISTEACSAKCTSITRGSGRSCAATFGPSHGSSARAVASGETTTTSRTPAASFSVFTALATRSSSVASPSPSAGGIWTVSPVLISRFQPAAMFASSNAPAKIRTAR
jgi:hypothetical protein